MIQLDDDTQIDPNSQKITLGSQATEYLNEKDHKMEPASLGSPDGFWHRFEPLEDSAVYCRGMEEGYHWQQNRDTVMLFVPLPEDRSIQTKEDVQGWDLGVKTFSIDLGHVQFGGRLKFSIDYELSTWYFEDDCFGNPFIIAELLKDDEYFNWPAVFSSSDSDDDDDSSDRTVGAE